MRRRELLAAATAGALAAIPVAGRGSFAQAAGKTVRVAVLTGLTEQDRETKARLAAFRQAMAALGWHEGQNLVIDTRFAPDTEDRARALVAELLALRPDVAVIQAPGMAAMRQANSTVPVVFVLGSDPVGAKWVESLAHPGGNITGLASAELSVGAKWVELLKETAPGVQHIAVVAHYPNNVLYRPVIEAAAKQLSIEIVYAQVDSPADIEAAIGTLAARPNGGLVLPTDAFTSAHRKQIVELAMRHRLPLSSGSEPFAHEGGLIVYAVDTVDVYRRSAAYVDRILRGAKPAELPVQQPTTYLLNINMKTAKALGLTIPPSILARADEVIE
jgi:putative ABC transport system substrate-binding protein